MAQEENEQDIAAYIKSVARAHALYTVIGEKTPKKNDHYLFIGRNGGEFAGNTKYLFLHFVQNVPQAKVHFLTEHRHVYRQLTQAKLPVLFFPSDGALTPMAEAATIVVESISFRRKLYYPLIAGTRQVQLWHGVGNKKIGFQLQGASCLEGRDQTLTEDHSDYDILVTTSPFYTEEVFKISMDAKEFVELGYPRTDVFFKKPDKNILLGCDTETYSRVIQARKKGPVILYTPTFRDSGVNPLTQDALHMDKLFELVHRLGAHLMIKPHTRTPVMFSGPLPGHVSLCNSTSDIYPFLPLADVMITDYSSIFTEYLLLDRPVLFFWADFDSYMKEDRGFQFPFEGMCPGPKYRTENELLQGIEDALTGKDDWKEQRRSLRDKAFSHTQGGAGERIAELLLQGEFA